MDKCKIRLPVNNFDEKKLLKNFASIKNGYTFAPLFAPNRG